MTKGRQTEDRRLTFIALATLALATACSQGPSNGFLSLDLSHAGSVTNVELPIETCFPGFFNASGDSWSVGLEEEEGGRYVELVIVTPDGERLVGAMDDSDGLTPNFSGSGSAELIPDGASDAEPATAEMAWLCG